MNKILGTLSVIAALASAIACGGATGPAGPGADEGAASAESTESTGEALSDGHVGLAVILANGTVQTPYSYSSPTGAITAVHTGLGVYSVKFAALTQSSPSRDSGNIQVSAISGGSERCKTTGGNQFTATVTVTCQKGATDVDVPFAVQWIFHTTNNGVGAYALVDDHTSQSYPLIAPLAWNSNGKPMSVLINTTGNYTVTLGGQATTGGSVQVTASGSNRNYCKVQSWYAVGADEHVNVLCFDPSGNPVNEMFSLNFLGHHNVQTHDYGAYVWANDAASSSYTPNSTYSYNTGGCLAGSNNARMTNNIYFMDHFGIDPTLGVSIVTAYGNDAIYCHPATWYALPNSNGTTVQTVCFTPSGAGARSQYVEVFSSGRSQTLC